MDYLEFLRDVHATHRWLEHSRQIIRVGDRDILLLNQTCLDCDIHYNPDLREVCPTYAQEMFNEALLGHLDDYTHETIENAPLDLFTSKAMSLIEVSWLAEDLAMARVLPKFVWDYI